MKKEKDILILSQYFYPEYITSSVLASDTAGALAAAGYTVDVFCGKPSEYVESKESFPQKETRNGINITRIKYFSSKRENLIGRLVNNFSFCFGLFWHLFEMRKYKLIISYSSPPMITYLASVAAGFFKNKVAFVAHDVYPEIAVRTGKCKQRGIMASFMNHINKKMGRHLSLLVCISEEMKEFFVKERKIPEDIIRVIPNWHEDLGCGAAETKHKFTCGYLGNMGICQDMDTVLEAVEKISESDEKDNIRFVFAGHGVKRDAVVRRTEHLDNVKHYGFLTGDDYKTVMNSCDCFIVSLDKGLGGLCAPSKMYSYLCMGRPVLAVLDEKDIIKDAEIYKFGFVTENGSPEKLAEAIIRLSKNPEEATEMGRNARRCFEENYTREKCLPEYVEAVRQLLG